MKKIKNQEDTGIQRVETSCVVFVSHKEASNLAAKIRFGQISIAILSAQLTETNEIFHQDDLLRLQDLIDEQISSSKSFL